MTYILISAAISVMSLVIYAANRKVDLRMALEIRRDIFKKSTEGMIPPAGYMNNKYRKEIVNDKDICSTDKTN